MNKKTKEKLKFFKMVLPEFKDEINRQNNEGNTPLLMMLSCSSNFQNPSVIELLLDYGANPNIVNNEGYNIFTAEETDLTIYNKIIESKKMKKDFISTGKDEDKQSIKKKPWL